jgi:predicted nucleic-acid-binding protein
LRSGWMKNRKMALFGAALILFILFASRGNHSFGKYIQSFANGKISKKEILPDHEIEELVYFYQQIMKKTKKEATKIAIDTLLENKAILQDAEKQDINVKEEELQKTIEFQTKHAKSIDSPELTLLLNGLDLTIEEYYNEYLYEKIRGKLVENKLFHEVTKDIEDPEKKNKRWDKEKQKIMKQFITINYVEIEQVKKRYNY